MTAREIIHTCSNVHVARAALASMGGDVAARVVDRAQSANLSVGALVAHMVKDFSRRAEDDQWDGVDEAARGADQPILSGLRYILDNELNKDAALYFFAEGRRLSPGALGPVAGGLRGM